MKKLRKKRKPSIELIELKRQIRALTSEMTQSRKNHLTLMKIVQEFRQESKLPPEERIRVVTQKTVEEPKTGFEAVLNWTTNQTNQHLNSLGESDLQDIIQSALTGKPVPEKQVKHHPNGTQGEMTNWLNQNIPVINTQENVWSSIEQAKKIAIQRVADRRIAAVDFTKDFIAAAKDSRALEEARKLADVDSAKTSTEIDEALRMGSG
jgi:hypothetical protein